MEGLSQRMRISWEIIQIIGKVYAFTVMEPKQLGIPSVTQQSQVTSGWTWFT